MGTDGYGRGLGSAAPAPVALSDASSFRGALSIGCHRNLSSEHRHQKCLAVIFAVGTIAARKGRKRRAQDYAPCSRSSPARNSRRAFPPALLAPSTDE